MIVAVLLLSTAAPSRADESQLQLADGPEVTSVRAYCSMCHSVDYIQMNSRFMKRAAWEAEVRKMIKAMGAPVADEDVPKLVDYLARNYGAE
ncbi:MAG: cytochrome c [Proteobacteria bacterium]|nr:cytochrome c [Pseudomonadota bacterium]